MSDAPRTRRWIAGAEVVLAIHEHQLAEHGGVHGIRDAAAVEALSNVSLQLPARLVVAGFGMVGFELVERLAALDALWRYDVTVVGEEPHPAYDRVRLTECLDHRDTAATTVLFAVGEAGKDVDSRQPAARSHAGPGPFRSA